MSKVPTLTLNSGKQMPVLGLGTWLSEQNQVKNAVKHALSHGYRHVDAAWIYENEHEVGEGLEEAFKEGIKREDVFVTSKLWCTHHHPDDAKKMIKETLSNLKLDYLDLYLVHWPMDFKRGDNKFPTGDDKKVLPADPPISIEENWRGMEALVEAGLTKSIGVSNYDIGQMRELLKVAKIKPAVLQIESHPYLQQEELIKLCKDNDIIVTAYSPLGNPSSKRPGASDDDPHPLEDPVIKEIAKKHGKTEAQVLLRFQIDRGLIVIPKSVNNERIEQNFDVFDFSLDKDDLEKIKGIDKNWRAVSMGPADQHEKYPKGF